jgi:hypothetical protein
MALNDLIHVTANLVTDGNEILCLCDVTLSVYPHRAGLKNMPGHGGIRTYDLWNTSMRYFGTESSSFDISVI